MPWAQGSAGTAMSTGAALNHAVIGGHECPPYEVVHNLPPALMASR